MSWHSPHLSMHVQAYCSSRTMQSLPRQCKCLSATGPSKGDLEILGDWFRVKPSLGKSKCIQSKDSHLGWLLASEGVVVRMRNVSIGLCVWILGFLLADLSEKELEVWRSCGLVKGGVSLWEGLEVSKVHTRPGASLSACFLLPVDQCVVFSTLSPEPRLPACRHHTPHPKLGASPQLHAFFWRELPCDGVSSQQ